MEVKVKFQFPFLCSLSLPGEMQLPSQTSEIPSEPPALRIKGSIARAATVRPARAELGSLPEPGTSTPREETRGRERSRHLPWLGLSDRDEVGALGSLGGGDISSEG